MDSLFRESLFIRQQTYFNSQFSQEQFSQHRNSADGGNCGIFAVWSVDCVLTENKLLAANANATASLGMISPLRYYLVEETIMLWSTT